MPEYFKLINDELWADWPEPPSEEPYVPFYKPYGMDDEDYNREVERHQEVHGVWCIAWQEYNNRPRYPCSASLAAKLSGSGKERFEIGKDFTLLWHDDIMNDRSWSEAVPVEMGEETSDGEKMYYHQLTKNSGRNKEYQYRGPKCVPGCKRYDHYETKHHKDCPFYPESFSKLYDNLESENASLKQQLETLKNKS